MPTASHRRHLVLSDLFRAGFACIGAVTVDVVLAWRAGRARLAKHKYAKCFREILKSKEKACHFLTNAWLTERQETGGRPGPD